MVRSFPVLLVHITLLLARFQVGHLACLVDGMVTTVREVNEPTMRQLCRRSKTLGTSWTIHWRASLRMFEESASLLG